MRFGLRSNSPIALDEAKAHLPLGWVPSTSPLSAETDGQQLTSPPSGGIEGGHSENTVDILYSLRLASSPHPSLPPRAGEGTVSPSTDSGRGARGGGLEHLLYCGSALISRTENLAELLTALENHTELLTAARSKDYLFVHAGVVAWEGKAILIPGRSMSGKTSLTRALLKAGATYYSDEFALLDKDGIVHPYPVPLSIRKGDNIVGCKTALEGLGIEPGTEPLPVGLVVIAKYERYARWKPETLTPSQSMLAMMNNTVAARGEPTFSMPILKKVAMNAKTIASKRGEAKRVARAILEIMTAAVE